MPEVRKNYVNQYVVKSHTILHIKNMVCPRCIMAVEKIFKELDIPVIKVELGEVTLPDALSEPQRVQVDKQVKEVGFELLHTEKSVLISRIKMLVIGTIHHSEKPLTINFSDFLSEKLNREYSYLSRLFSSVEGITVEKFIITQKIEKVKELLFYDELTLSEISYRLNYSSVAHLSAQFKKETGMTPSQFKTLKKPGHHSLDAL